jgi:hypothetical protein
MDDTSPEALALQTDIHRKLGGAGRLLLAFEMSLLVRELAIARLRREHPTWSDPDFKRELLRYAFSPAPLPGPLR